jgi:hypothetical protein
MTFKKAYSMIKVNLYVRINPASRTLEYVTTAIIPPFQTMVEVLIWGNRVFRREQYGVGTKAMTRYVECFAVAVVSTENNPDNPDFTSIMIREAEKEEEPADKAPAIGDDSLLMGLPKDLDEAIETMKEFYGGSLIDAFMKMTEEEFRSSTHFGAGMFIRNSWYLWWNEDHTYKEWPKSIPPLVQWFREHDIYHADDMSSIIITSTYRNRAQKPLLLEQQIEVYKAHWKKHGFPDGIPKSTKK